VLQDGHGGVDMVEGILSFCRCADWCRLGCKVDREGKRSAQGSVGLGDIGAIDRSGVPGIHCKQGSLLPLVHQRGGGSVDLLYLVQVPVEAFVADGFVVLP